MYYQEKWENGLLYVKTTPNGNWKLKSPTLADLHEAVESKEISLARALDLAYLRGKNSK